MNFVTDTPSLTVYQTKSKVVYHEKLDKKSAVCILRVNNLAKDFCTKSSFVVEKLVKTVSTV